jgi:hypothetical protein
MVKQLQEKVLEKPTVMKVGNNPYYKLQEFITVFTKARHQKIF